MRRMFGKLILGVALAVLALEPGASMAAQKKAPAQDNAAVKEQTAKILDNALKALAALKGYTFHADITLDKVYKDGTKIQSARSMDVTVQRPNAFKVVSDGDDFQAMTVFDGKTFSLGLTDRKVYAQLPFTGTTDALMDMLSVKYGIESPLGDLLSGDPCSRMDTRGVMYVGKSKVGGVVCDHLFFKGKDIDWQLWVEDGPSALPRKMVITEKKLPQSPQFSAVFSGWKLADNAPETFAFTAPEGFTRDDKVVTGARPGR